MRPVAALPVQPGNPVTLAPGGYHIMLMGLKQQLKQGDSFPVTPDVRESRRRDNNGDRGKGRRQRADGRHDHADGQVAVAPLSPALMNYTFRFTPVFNRIDELFDGVVVTLWITALAIVAGFVLGVAGALVLRSRQAWARRNRACLRGGHPQHTAACANCSLSISACPASVSALTHWSPP